MTRKVFIILKWLRVAVAVCLIMLLTAYFLHPFTPETANDYAWLTATQMMPDLLKMLAFGTVSAAIGFFAVIAVTLLCGRVYCSVICPLGILQDLVAWFGRRVAPVKKHGYAILPGFIRLRTGVVLVCFGAFALGVIYPLMLLEPFSFYGRIVNNLVKPVYTAVNALWTAVEYPPFILSAFIFSTVTLMLLAAAVFKYGRIYCNSLCPVGAVLGFLSRYAWFKIRINADCRNCGRCEKLCKAGCIDYKNNAVDFSRCVMCLNCVAACPFDAVHLEAGKREKIEPVDEVDETKREFIAFAGIAALAVPALASPVKPKPASAPLPVMPPGAMKPTRFHAECTACHLCVGACPNQIIRPALTAYGLRGFMQPYLNYSVKPCEQGCNVCSQVCPTGALMPLPVEQKNLLKIGLARYEKSRCIVVTGKIPCGQCAASCPCGAITMIEWQNGLTIPTVDPTLCIGCGYCEAICPAKPRKAIIVQGIAVQQPSG